MRFQKIRIISNPRKPWAGEVALQVKKYLLNAGYKIVADKADLTVCIGGDGTILYANHEWNISGAVLGIGGEKSVICQLNKSNWKNKLLRLVRKAETENRLMLKASCSKKEYSAINDFVIHSRDYRVIEIALEINGKKHHFEGDGLIISSATGSLAYAYSAGGKRQKPRSKRIQVVPIAPYLRAFKPHIIPGNSSIKINTDRESAFIVDGIFIKNLAAKEKIIVSSGKHIKFLTK